MKRNQPIFEPRVLDFLVERTLEAQLEIIVVVLSVGNDGGLQPDVRAVLNELNDAFVDRCLAPCNVARIKSVVVPEEIGMLKHGFERIEDKLVLMRVVTHLALLIARAAHFAHEEPAAGLDRLVPRLVERLEAYSFAPTAALRPGRFIRRLRSAFRLLVTRGSTPLHLGFSSLNVSLNSRAIFTS